LKRNYIVVVTYNSIPWIDKCLGSIDFSLYEVLVVDNNSSDETVQHLQNTYPKVILFEETQNLGFGQANNRGISYALKQGAEHVFLLNQDAYLVGNCLEKLIDFQKRNSNYAVLSPIHTNGSISRIDRNFSNYLTYDRNSDFYSDYVLGKTLKDVYDVPFVNAAGWLLSKECLMKVGGFDPIFFHYGEDDNYCQRILYHGLKIGVIPDALMIHDREYSKKPNIIMYSDVFFKVQDRRLKVKYANINTYDSTNLISFRKKIRKQLIKAHIKQNRKQIIANKTYLKLIDKIMIEISVSVNQNKIEQPNYLEL
jgi:GT2 family glycosyltransferase